MTFKYNIALDTLIKLYLKLLWHSSYANVHKSGWINEIYVLVSFQYWFEIPFRTSDRKELKRDETDELTTFWVKLGVLERVWLPKRESQGHE